MNWIDLVCVAVIGLFTFLGFKRGVIKTGVQLVGTIAVLILSFVFKDVLANFLMKFMPFFNFSGIFEGITSLNILIYELLSFIFIFIILYCILNILLTLSGLIETILKLTIILALPSKILGALLGLIEGIVVAFVMAFIMLHSSFTVDSVINSKVAIVVLERAPVIGSVTRKNALALQEIRKTLDNLGENENREDANFKVLHTLISYQIISQEDAQQLIKNNKIVFKNDVIFGN